MPGVTIKKGEEFFASYGYSPKLELPWYRDAFNQFRKENPEPGLRLMKHYKIHESDELLKDCEGGEELAMMGSQDDNSILDQPTS
jgi:hypothetical protein